ncbi:MAG: DUF4906 domain-containing protein [Bacteroidales bacterium]|nr:DUF4906 domain-containing protein [Bacteroidales bacterium]
MRNIRTHAALLLLLLTGACAQEHPETETVFRTMETETETRSLLGETVEENRKTGITLAAYTDGKLFVSAYYTSSLEAMRLNLERDTPYTVYALVNMGDRRRDLPDSEAGLSAWTYRIPSYTEGAGSLTVQGLPMAGRLDYSGGSTAIPVERLLAKVTARLSCEWDGASIREVRVRNLNRTLRPFGTGSASGPEDILDQQEFQEGTGSASGTFTFYVPENLQGTVKGVSAPSGKSPDKNAEVAARADRLTFLEAVVDASGLYKGTITYRSYLGKDAVSDFDIRRNAHYVWTVRYLLDGLQYDDWKHENHLLDPSGLNIDDEWDNGGESELH